MAGRCRGPAGGHGPTRSPRSRTLRDAAPAELRDEWDTAVLAFEALVELQSGRVRAAVGALEQHALEACGVDLAD